MKRVKEIIGWTLVGLGVIAAFVAFGYGWIHIVGY